MKQSTFNFKWVPEFYFILVSILWYYLNSSHQEPNENHVVNFPAILLIVAFHIQLFLDDHIFGKALSVTALIANIYLISNFIIDSEVWGLFSENQTQLLMQVIPLCGMNFLMSYLMFSKYKRYGIGSEEPVGLEE